ncbi:DUF397 domain-containing protein [Nocardia takedensis]|uniref:DUF397 domain-containing protein n=1 Tax=Nocardia takedensis TaxID=259390 RepID=UPI003F76878B
MITPDSAQADRGWRKSSYSGSDGGACVEVRIATDTVRIRDTKYSGDPAEHPEILVPASRWTEFLHRALHLSSVTPPGLPVITHDESGHVTIRDTPGVTLVFTPAEWEAFTAGIRSGEFIPLAA